MEDFMDSVLWVPFREPAFRLHGQRVRGAPLPNLSAESRDENLALARIWDAKSLTLDRFAKVTSAESSMLSRMKARTGR